MGKFQAGLRDSLILFARQHAWLHAVPRRPTPKRPRTTASSQPDDSQPGPTRAQQLQADGRTLPLPPLASASALWHWLHDAGLYSRAGFNGRQPLGWSDLDAWQRGTGVRLAPWQARAMLAASAAWVFEYAQASEPDHPQPWMSAHTIAADRATVDRKMRGILSAMKPSR